MRLPGCDFTSEDLDRIQAEIPTMNDDELHALVKWIVPTIKATHALLEQQALGKNESGNHSDSDEATNNYLS